jgi:hypothetical protein
MFYEKDMFGLRTGTRRRRSCASGTDNSMCKVPEVRGAKHIRESGRQREAGVWSAEELGFEG